MGKSDYIYESGEAITVGSDGDHAYVSASGSGVLDRGKSSYVFESGTGLGGGSLVVEGTEVGFFESDMTHSDWFNWNTSGDSYPNAEGLENNGVLDNDGTRTLYLHGHYSTASDTYAFGTHFWAYHTDNGETFIQDTLFTGFGDYALSPTDPVWADNPPSHGSNEIYTTDSNGDPLTNHAWSWSDGDGVGYEFNPGASFTITVEIYKGGALTTGDDGSGSGANPYQAVRGRGPIANTSLSWGGYGSTYTVEISV